MLAFLFAGFLVGLLLVSIYDPVLSKKKVVPEPGDPERIYHTDGLANGCVRLKAREVPCPADWDSVNLLSVEHK
jgi:hypothetical protein